MAYQLSDLGRIFHDQLYNSVTGGDGSVPPAQDAFITWCMPGLPFQPADFTFAAKGIGTGATAEEDKILIQQAFNFATLVDFLPDVTSAYTSARQDGVWRNASGSRLSEIYGQILKFSRVVNDDLTDDEKAKLDKFRGILWTTVKSTDPFTNAVTETTVPGPAMVAYQECEGNYVNARLDFNNKRIAAQAATGPEGKQAVADWSANAELYRLKVNSAADAWTSKGYRNQVDQMNAYINQVTEKSMLLWKQVLESRFSEGFSDALGPGARFPYTTVVPGGFADAPGWTNYSMYHAQVASSARTDTTSWSAGTGISWGFWNSQAAVTDTSSHYSENFTVDNFSMSFSMTQVQIVRPWFYPEFLENRGWSLQKGVGWNYDEMPSDGGKPPKGRFIGYPLQALFVKDVTIRSAGFAQAFRDFSNSISGNASVGWGPFTLKGSYGHAESGNNYNSNSDGATVTVPGMQIIGFVNHLLGKTPNLLDGLKFENLV